MDRRGYQLTATAGTQTQFGLAISGKLIYCVTILALVGSRFVKDHRLARNFARKFVAVQTGHVNVSAIERIR